MELKFISCMKVQQVICVTYIVYTSTDTSYPGPGHNFPKGFDDCSK